MKYEEWEAMGNVKYEEINLASTRKLIETHRTFNIVGLEGKMSSAVTSIKSIVESEGLKCRVFTHGRAITALSAFASGITSAIGGASIIGVTGHEIATFNPDYEIVKHHIQHKLVIRYTRNK